MHYSEIYYETYTGATSTATDAEIEVVTITDDMYMFETLTKKEQAIEDIKNQPFFK